MHCIVPAVTVFLTRIPLIDRLPHVGCMQVLFVISCSSGITCLAQEWLSHCYAETG